MNKTLPLLLTIIFALCLSACAEKQVEQLEFEIPILSQEEIIDRTADKDGELLDDAPENADKSEFEKMIEQNMNGEDVDLENVDVDDLVVDHIFDNIVGIDSSEPIFVISANMTTFYELEKGDDLSDFIKENGFVDAKWNENGSITCTMTKEAHKEAKAFVDAIKSNIKKAN